MVEQGKSLQGNNTGVEAGVEAESTSDNAVAAMPVLNPNILGYVGPTDTPPGQQNPSSDAESGSGYNGGATAHGPTY